ncbi:T9SS type B sorting domain-containing protein [Cesiribacter andamanensis]|nr:gliding motility-associated C-terminal domain-containing protein [Cesiribacter andamanensis]
MGEPYLISGAHPNSSYTVVVADRDNDATPLTAEVGSTSGVVIDAFTLTPNSCATSGDGQISLEVSGGSGNYRYSLDGGATFVSNPIANLADGTYTVSVYDANTNCFATGTYTITNSLSVTVTSPLSFCRSDEAYDLLQAVSPSAEGGVFTFSGPGVSGTTFDPALASAGANTINIVYSVNGCSTTAELIINVNQAPTVTASLTHINCFGENTGAIDLSISGGAAPYTFDWGGGISTEDRTALLAGTYTVTVTDQNGCAVQQSFTITQAEAINIQATVTDVRCKGEGNGTISLSVSGGSGSYTYLWEYQGRTSQNLSGLMPGEYAVTVTDSQGCTAEASFTIAEPEALTASIALGNPVSCAGASDAALALTVAGGTAPYSYVWNFNNADTQNLNGVGAGTYSVTVTDTRGCQTTASITVGEPAALTLTYTVENATTCGGSQGSIDLEVAGGTAPYSYTWDYNGLTSQDISSLPAGTYGVTVRDDRGCTAAASIVVAEPAGISAVNGSLTQISCNGAADGAIVLTVSGGQADYTYNWSNGASTKDISGLVPGTYTVTVTDANECSFEASFIITQPLPLALEVQPTHVLCAGGTTGAVNLSVSGGTAPYAYSWNGGAYATEDLANLPAGTYTIIVSDANGCTETASVTLTQPDAITATASSSPASCFGGTDGSITLSVSGGVGTYTYLWSNGATSRDVTNLAAGSYWVDITDANSCTIRVAATVAQPTQLVAGITGLSSICEGSSDGWVQVSPSGGTAPYSVLWDNGSTASRINNLPAGTYSVTVTDANQCTASASFTITEPSMLVDLGDDLTLCAGQSVTLRSGHNAGNNNILWSTGATSPNISVTTSGTYWVRVTDRTNGCEGYDEVVVTVIPNEPVTVSLAPAAPITCHTTSVELVATPTNGGSAPTYAWSLNGAPVGGNSSSLQLESFADGDVVSVQLTPDHTCSTGPATASYTLNTLPGLSLSATVTDVSCFEATNGAIDLSVTGGSGSYTYSWSTTASTEDVNGLAAGTYTVTVSDQAGCSESLTVTVGQPDQLLATAVPSPVTSCTGGNGAIELTVSGGSGTYTYLWSNGSTDKDLSGLSAGTYRVDITDSMGCTASAEATITQPAPITLTTSVVDATSCGGSNGSIGLNVSGGSGTYTYSWSNGATSRDLSDLAAGTYTVDVTDGNGCVATAEVVVGEPAGITSLSAVVTDAACNGAASGALVLTVSGGTAPYTYLWSNGATSKDLENLLAGSYTVTATDANGCSLQQSFTIAQPAALALSAVATATSACGAADGAINLTVSGGTAPYTYSWNEGAFTTEDLNALTAGIYTIYIEDAAGCAATATYTVTDGNGPTITASVEDASCFGAANGSINLSVSGGTAPYTYAWENGATTEDLTDLPAGTYPVSVQDANGCMATASITVGQAAEISIVASATDLTSCTSANGAISLAVTGGSGTYTYLWNTGAVTADLTDLAAGTYSVTVTDSRGCTATATASVAAPDGIVLTTEVSNATSCGSSDGAIALTVNGGTAPYTYSWNGGAYASEDLSGLSAGEYTVTVTDATGCTATTVTRVAEPSGISSLDATISHVNCFGATTGAIALTVSGGTAPYSYSWDNGAATATLTDLAAGVYTVTVTDANGCTFSQGFEISQPAALALSAVATPASACGAADGSLDLTVGGGNAPYSFRWSNEAVTEDLANLAAGTYSVEVTDANGCVATASYTIGEPASISITASVTGLSTCTAADGAIDLSVEGGDGSYTYLWNTGATSQDLTGLSAGDYTVLVTDASGCTATASVSIAPVSSLVVTATATDASSCTEANGAISLVIEGGEAPYTYLWNTGATTQNLSGLAAGSYTVTVTDALGCETTLTTTISAPAGISLTAVAEGVSCFGGANGSISLQVEGGTAPFSYLWNTGATTQNLTGLAAGTYSVVVSDAAGCSASESITITAPAELQLAADVRTTSACGAEDGSIRVEVRGGTAPYTFSWSTGASDESISGLAPGAYTVTVTDAAGCSLSRSYSISDPAAPEVTAIVQSLDCSGNTSGSIDITVTGGTAPYTYAWNTGATSEDLSGLQAGAYDVTVTDAEGCSSNMRFTIRPASDLQLSATPVAATCFGSATGSISLALTGGTAPYSYSWNTGATSESLTELVAGTYSVTVTDATGCSVSATATVTQPEELLLAISGTARLCAGASDGSLSAAVTGGVAPYTYLWSTGAATETLENLAAGTYQLQITDANGCVATATHTISEERLVVDLGADRALCAPASLNLNAGYDPATHSIRWSTGSEEAEITVSTSGTYSVTVTDLATGCSGTDEVLVEIENEFVASVTIRPVDAITCNSAQVVLEAVPAYGGDAPTYQWWNAVTGEMVGTESRLTVPSFNNGDSFMVEMTTSLACASPATSSDMYQILLPTLEAPVLSSSEASVCIGSTMPTITAANGGTLRWYKERVDPSTLVFEGTAFTPADTEEGTYTYYVTEITSLCGESPATTFVLSLYTGECEPETCEVSPAVAIRILPGREICAEITTLQLEADVEQVGTNPGFAWFFNDETAPFSTEASASYTAAGGFAEGDRFRVEVTITDAAFICEGRNLISATETLRLVEEMPLAVNLSSSAPNGACPGTPITFTASAPAAGADPVYTFFTIAPDNSVREEQSGRSNSFVLNAAQNGQQVYVQVRVTDPAVVCTVPEAASQPVAVRVLTSEECVGNPVACEQFTIEVTELVRPSCGLDNGKLTFYITSRTSPFRLSYTLGDRIVQEQVNSPYVLTVDNIPALQNLRVVLGEGANQCVFNYYIEQAPRLDITFEKLPDGDIVCHGENSGKARLTVNGGNAPYQYLLEGSTVWQTLNGTSIDFTNLPAGINNILVRANADDTCPDVASVEIRNLNEPLQITTTMVQQANCNDNIGVFRLETISGGVTGNGYRVRLASEDSWRDFVPGMEFNGLARGRHVLVISDGQCQYNRTVVVPSPGLIALSEESGVIDFTCERPELRNGIFLKIDGSITEVAGPYVADFYLMNSQGQYQLISSEQIFNGNGELYKFQLERGSYRVEVRNINREGCPEVAEYVIEGSEIPVPITFEAEAQSIYCEDATGGVLITNLQGAAGLRYEVEIRDADGNLALSKTITTFEYATQESFEIMGLPKGLYRMVIMQDQGLCNTIETSRPVELLIRETDRKLAVSITGKTVSFPERATGSLTFRVANGSGTAPYTASLVWMDRVEDQDDWVFESHGDPVTYNQTTGRYEFTYSQLPPGVYELTVVDAKGCTVVLRDTIMYDTNLFIPNIITPNGDGSNEVFYIRNKPARTQLTITNRWGKVVYESADYQNNWDGGDLSEGIYFYSIKAPQNENGVMKGWLEIRRGARPN